MPWTSSPAPQSSSRAYDEAARASAAVVIKRYSTSFGWATRLLQEPVRTHVRSIYAMVRVADELVDDESQPWDRAQRARLLDGLQQDIHQAAESGGSANLIVHAFTLTAVEHGIGPELVDPFFDSMRADLSVQLHDPASLVDYVYGSAEVVGLMCLRVFVHGDDHVYEELSPGARRLGAAFQKVNFLRDLQADQQVRGRTYFPGVDLSTFTDRERDQLLDDIDADLEAASAAILRLPASSRRAVHAAHGLFVELSSRLRATPAAEIAQGRVRVPDRVKAQILARSALVTR
ncbi:MAG TPA: phytoene/squalene synthase family protein [Ornithinicoccus sp.]|nr:phytoene/squalene synthase family protein [Ornithinicoccus sp.]